MRKVHQQALSTAMALGGEIERLGTFTVEGEIEEPGLLEV